MSAPPAEAVRRTLERHGQEHVLRFYDDLDAERQRALLDQLSAVDFDLVSRLVRAHLGVDPAMNSAVPDDLAPVPYLTRGDETGSVTPPGRAFDETAAREAGEDVIRRGGLAVFTVAGGQGTRLGWNGPKGTYPATTVTGKPLFRCFAEQILAAERAYEVSIPWYIMTSPENDAATRAFFQDNNCFGLMRNNIMLFPQGTMPSVDAESGRLLLAAPDRLAVSPDGHGGSIAALRRNGALDDMEARGIEQISYHQVDNPLTRAVDPVFIGLHVSAEDSSGQVSSKMVTKRAADEPVGVFVRSGGRTLVIEYSDLPTPLAEQRDGHGHLRFIAGSIAVHVISVAFAAEIGRSGDEALPFHAARKKVPYLDVDGACVVEPERPNAIKFEKFIFDVLPVAGGSIVLETNRADEFAPIKNAEGQDSPATSHRIQCDRAGRWLEAHGVDVPRDEAGHVTARLEISPLTAMEPADLAGVDLPERIAADDEVVL